MKDKPSKVFVINEILKMAEQNPEMHILDLGCGHARNFLRVLEKYPQIHYVGIELDKNDAKIAADVLKNFPNAVVKNNPAYLQDNEKKEEYDLVVSLSVLEHVKDLRNFLLFSACSLKPGGEMIHLYDLGHSLHPSSLKEKMQIFLSNNFGAVLPENKYCGYVDSDFVASVLQQKGVVLDRVTYHNMSGHVTALKSFSHHEVDIMERVISLEVDMAEKIVNRKEREFLFPSVCLRFHKI